MERIAPGELVQFLTRFPPSIGELFLAARETALRHAPEATEFVTNASYTLASGFTFSHSVKHMFLYVGAYSKHVNIGFCHGALVEDPLRRLRGDGKSMRHVQIHSLEDLDDPYLHELLDRATAAAHRPVEPLLRKMVITRMKKDQPPS